MPRSYGYWLNPQSGEAFSVTRHQDWILEHASDWGLQQAVQGLDADRDEDQIRLLGCQAGLVRVRDYGLRMSVQFWAEDPAKVRQVQQAVFAFLPKIQAGPFTARTERQQA